MRDIIGTENKRTIQLKDNEALIRFTDFTDMERVIVMSLDEQLPLIPLKEGTAPVISM